MVVRNIVFGQEEGAKTAHGSHGEVVYIHPSDAATIVRRPTRLTIFNTGVPVSAVVGYRKLGYSVSRILQAMPHLRRRDVEYALSLYQREDSVRLEVDAEIAAQQA